MKNKNKIIYNKFINKKYIIKKIFKTGIILKGWEVKSILKNNIDIKNNYVYIDKYKEIYIKNINISPLKNQIINNKNRKIKLLLKKNEIYYLYNNVKAKGYTIILLSIIIKNPWYKTKIALCKGKKIYDKRKYIKYKHWNKNINIDI